MPKQKSYKQKMQELEKITQWFEQEDIDLDDSLKKFEEGVQLAGDIKKHLEKAEAKIIDIKKQHKDILS